MNGRSLFNEIEEEKRCINLLYYFFTSYSEKPVGSIPHTGTIISAHRPFFNIPVRRQMEQKTFSFKRIQDLLIKYSLVYPMVRFALTSVGSSRGIKKWIQPSTSGVMNAIVAAYGSQLSDMLEHHHVTAPNKQLSIECVLAKPNAGNNNNNNNIYICRSLN